MNNIDKAAMLGKRMALNEAKAKIIEKYMDCKTEETWKFAEAVLDILDEIIEQAGKSEDEE